MINNDKKIIKKETDNARKTVLNVLIIVSFKNKTSKALIELDNKKINGIKKPKVGGKKQKEIKNIFFNFPEDSKFVFFLLLGFKLIFSLEKNLFCKNKIKKIKNKKKIDICAAKFISPKPIHVL